MRGSRGGPAGAGIQFGEELNSSVLKRRIKGLTDSSRRRHFLLGVRESFGGELNFPVGKGLIKGLTAVWSP
eukprot:1951889-Pyramimonas_sp.AAC.1